MSLYRLDRSPFYWCRFWVRGREYRLSTRQRDRRTAAREERKLRDAATKAKPPPRAAEGLDLAMLAGLDVERAAAAGAMVGWLTSLELTWSPVCRHLGAITPAAVDYDAIEGYVGARRAEGVRGQTIRREVQALRRGLSIAERHGWIPSVPKAPAIKSGPRDERRRGKLHPAPIIREWLAAMSGDARDHALFAALTGLRAAELARVRAEWVVPAPAGSATAAVLRVPAEAAKSRSERVIGLSLQAIEILRRRVVAPREDGLLFGPVDYRRARRDACVAIGYEQTITLRDLRHTYATLALAATGDPWATAQALGHADLRTTAIYQSTTAARATVVAAAVADALTGAAKPEQRQKMVGAQGFEPWAPSSQSDTDPVLEHARICAHCRLILAEHVEMQAEAARHRSTDPEQQCG